jgi:hypothetical protein
MANGVAYGFVGLTHLWSERVTEVGEQRIWDAVRESAAMHSTQLAAVMAEFAQPTTDRTRKIMLPGSGELQPLDEHGNPLPTRPEGSYDVAFPIYGGGDAWGDNRVTRALATVDEANRWTLEALKKDARWVRRHALAAILTDGTRTYADPQGNITIQPLANDDSVVYNRVGGAAATDDHYLAQAAAIADNTNPFPTLYDELAEHPENNGPYVAYVPTNVVVDIEGLTDFLPTSDPNVRYGISSDGLAGTVDLGPGDELVGYVGKFFIIEWKALPDDYIIAVARGTNPVLGMRQYPSAALQGFFPESNDVDGNHMEQRLIRYAGFGVQNRVAAVAMFVEAGDTTYDNPANYVAPLAV